MNRLNHFLRHSESRWVVLLLTIAIVFLLLFYFDYTSEADIGNRKKIGTIVYKNNQVQRKFAGEVVWSNLRSNSPLTNMDLIRSENLSDAIIYLDGGTNIRIDENTMFFLDFSSGALKLEFEGGSIQIEQGKDTVGGMTIKSGDTVIEVGDADLKIVDSDDKDSKDKINLYVSKGSARINMAGQASSISANQKAYIGKDGVKIKDVEVQLIKPGGQDLISSDSNSGIPFDFKARKGFRAIGLEIAQDKFFTRIVKKATPANAKKGIKLNSGSYFWRVKAKNKKTGEVVKSETRRFRMIENKPVKTFQPNSGEEFTYVEDKPSITFSWESSNLVAQYTVQVAKDKNFKVDKKEYKTELSRLNINDLGAGSYFWRIKSKSNITGIKDQITKPNRLKIRKMNSFQAPLVGRPSNGLEIADTDLKSGVLFVWQAMPELKKYDFEVSKDAGFKQKVVTKKKSENYLKLKEPLKAGNYYWRVRGETSAGKKSDFSKVASFKVVTDKVANKTDENQTGLLELKYPVGIIDMSKRKALAFGWKKEEGVKVYKLTLYQLKGRRAIQVLTKRVAGGTWNLVDLALLDTGNFRWRMQAIRKGGKGTIKTQDFKIILSEQIKNLESGDIEFISPEVMYK